MKKIFMVLGIVIVSFNTFAMELSVEKAVGMALKKNIEIKKAEIDVENAKLQVKEAIKGSLPKIGYSFIYNKQQDKISMNQLVGGTKFVGNTLTGIPVYSDGTVKNLEIANSDNIYMHTLTLTQPIYNGGLEIAGIKNSKLAENMSKYNLTKKEQDLKVQIIEEYINIIKLKHQKNILENSIKEMKENREKLNEMYKEKMITKTPILDIEYAVINLEGNMIGVENGIEISKEKLKNDIGLDESEDIKVSELSNISVDFDKINLEDDIQKALDKGISVKLIENMTKLQKASEAIQMAGLLPKINFQFKYSSPTGAFKISDSVKLEDWNWSAGVSFNMDVWDWGTNLSKLKRAKNETKKKKYDEENAKENIKLGIKSKYLELKKLKKMLESKNKAMESAKENYQLEKQKFEYSIISTTDLISAENKYRSSEIDVDNTKLDYYLADLKYKNMIDGEVK
ncbi:TolC family protein [Haliovirga abyssi]|uniref:Alkaline protease n=1 Tax=Haliovirga abyssi TaxID=2996794 RepID=A0AAU9D0M8_9FUSO|nr:TolC family protein [Haliovirga abyssi]BDU49511.1 alkaline protease [Haliovirga abyssi]